MVREKYIFLAQVWVDIEKDTENISPVFSYRNYNQINIGIHQMYI